MSAQRFVMRLLDAEGQLLGWTQQHLQAQGGVFATPATEFLLERAGVAVSVSVHWTELDVARVEPLLLPMEVPASHVGRAGVFYWTGPVWVVRGQAGVPLPPVTVRGPVAVAVPTGALGAVV